ncbi:DEAD/DEAH box helicase [Candidatus Synchoanobacter obligatus]|uniref:DEAD/DEAH box helicase family protein n=1 Tax=Candidatus Synchoanobacter obligatus TaxID=2919597 RepID=A0ABT1L3M9_9GAMM|nr:DEAD/DEAH box helicase [Candidatus Synchoanobacter obligatus]MCP8351815.1 DEAD/DEAH box helicase family protein [Candidatus Synchoanobacter obligatus]
MQEVKKPEWSVVEQEIARRQCYIELLTRLHSFETPNKFLGFKSRLTKLLKAGDGFLYNRSQQLAQLVAFLEAISKKPEELSVAILDMATGSGKTHTFMLMLFLLVAKDNIDEEVDAATALSFLSSSGGAAAGKSAVAKHFRGLVVVPTIELKSQALMGWESRMSAYSELLGLEPVVIQDINQAAKKAYSPATSPDILLSCQQSLASFSNQKQKHCYVSTWAKDHQLMCIFDEADLIFRESFVRELVSHINIAAILAVSATAKYRCGTSLNIESESTKLDLVAHALPRISLSDAIEAKLLSPLCITECYVAAPRTKKKIPHMRGDDFVESQLQLALNQDDFHHLVAHLIATGKNQYGSHFMGRPTLVVASGIEHANRLVAVLNEHYASEESQWSKHPMIPDRVKQFAFAYHSKVSAAEKDRCLKGFSKGESLVMVGVRSVVAGLDLPFLETVIAFPSASERAVIQRAGRVTRLFPGKKIANLVEMIFFSEQQKTMAKIAEFDGKISDTLTIGVEAGYQAEEDHGPAKFPAHVQRAPYSLSSQKNISEEDKILHMLESLESVDLSNASVYETMADVAEKLLARLTKSLSPFRQKSKKKKLVVCEAGPAEITPSKAKGKQPMAAQRRLDGPDGDRKKEKAGSKSYQALGKKLQQARTLLSGAAVGSSTSAPQAKRARNARDRKTTLNLSALLQSLKTLMPEHSAGHVEDGVSVVQQFKQIYQSLSQKTIEEIAEASATKAAAVVERERQEKLFLEAILAHDGETITQWLVDNLITQSLLQRTIDTILKSIKLDTLDQDLPYIDQIVKAIRGNQSALHRKSAVNLMFLLVGIIPISSHFWKDYCQCLLNTKAYNVKQHYPSVIKWVYSHGREDLALCAAKQKSAGVPWYWRGGWLLENQDDILVSLDMAESLQPGLTTQIFDSVTIVERLLSYPRSDARLDKYLRLLYNVPLNRKAFSNLLKRSGILEEGRYLERSLIDRAIYVGKVAQKFSVNGAKDGLELLHQCGLLYKINLEEWHKAQGIEISIKVSSPGVEEGYLSENNIASVKYLIDRKQWGLDPAFLFDALAANKLDMVAMLLANGYKVTAKLNGKSFIYTLIHQLYLGVGYYRQGMIKLCQQIAQLSDKKTVLHYIASESGDHVELVKYSLFRVEKDSEQLDSSGKTALFYAKQVGNVAIQAELEQHENSRALKVGTVAVDTSKLVLPLKPVVAKSASVGKKRVNPDVEDSLRKRLKGHLRQYETAGLFTPAAHAFAEAAEELDAVTAIPSSSTVCLADAPALLPKVGDSQLWRYVKEKHYDGDEVEGLYFQSSDMSLFSRSGGGAAAEVDADTIEVSNSL